MDFTTLYDPYTIHTHIGHLLDKAGWKMTDSSQVYFTRSEGSDILVKEPTFFDYYLYRTNGEILAVMEVTQAISHIHLGSTYADTNALQRMPKQSFRPFKLYTNGQQIFMWDTQAGALLPLQEGSLIKEILEKKLHDQFTSQQKPVHTLTAPDKEEQLWQAFRQGDYKAFTLIYKKHIQPLYNYGSKITTDRALVEDCIHDLFVELWKNRLNLSQVHSVKHYLLKALKWKLIRCLGKNTVQKTLSEEYDFEIVFSHEFAIITTQITHDQEKQLKKALTTLSDRQREAIFLRYYEGFSYEEIASMMSISVKTAYNFIYMALVELRKNLTKLVPAILLLCSMSAHYLSM